MDNRLSWPHSFMEEPLKGPILPQSRALRPGQTDPGNPAPGRQSRPSLGAKMPNIGGGGGGLGPKPPSRPPGMPSPKMTPPEPPATPFMKRGGKAKR